MTRPDLATRPFVTLAQLLAEHAVERGAHVAAIDRSGAVTYGELDRRITTISAALQRDGVGKGDTVAICAANGIGFLEVFLGTIAAGGVAVPLSATLSSAALAAQLADCGAAILFTDANAPVDAAAPARHIALDGPGGTVPAAWLAGVGPPAPVSIDPEDAFNIIYSSGTTGTPKGIVQPHAMRWSQIRRAIYPADAVTLLSTPLYSNTTLVSLLPTLAAGGTVVLMAKFDETAFLALCEKHRVTHTMLVPVQYRRLLDHPDFATTDLNAFRMKFATSSPFSAGLKREVLDRWPGGLTEFYGMTEGGGTCVLPAHEHPDKLHTVGRPLPGHVIEVIDDRGQPLHVGAIGEVVGRSPAMMTGYHRQPYLTAEAERFDGAGERFIRTGDLGRFDTDGFLELVGRRKDMVISGGFNIYPGDLEAVLVDDPAIEDAAVVGVPCERWGETPVAFVTLRSGAAADAGELLDRANRRLGRTQRLADLRIIDALPRNAIGKVLKRDLRDLGAGAGR